MFVFFVFLWISLGNYEIFLNDLRTAGVEVDRILESDQISRYELSRLLNTVSCQDCVNTPNWMIEKYTNNWRLDFIETPGKDFDDIIFGSSYYNWKPYYYCVAYVGDNNWMRWYPQWISPVCDWKFCWHRNTTVGEFLQVVLNISDQYIFNRYLADWWQIKKWMDWLTKWTYPYEYLNKNDRDIINMHAQNWLSWILPNKESLQAYIKYCMFNLNKCGMQSFGAIKQWYWPVWELNILYDHNIVEHEKFKNWQIHELVSWEYVLKTLYNVFKIVDCDFDDDYDKDGILNAEDNCPNHYNPSQKDTDGDGVWDVCDSDIDWDGVWNPIGIVDDLWKVIISKWESWIDNCLFIKNPDQKDTGNKGIGDACRANQSNLGMYIKSDFIPSNAPLTVNFEAITEGVVQWEITRDFWDWNHAVWREVSNTFLEEWIYQVQANAEWINNNAHAVITIVVGKNASENYSVQIATNKLGWMAPVEIKFTAITKWSFDKFEWNLGEGDIIERTDKGPVIKIYKTQWSYMVTLKWIKNNQVLSVANVIIAVGDDGEIGSNLRANPIMPKKWETINLQTDIFGFEEKDISSIEWNMGNWEVIKNGLLNMGYIYKKVGTYVIIQNILLKNWRKLQNFLTVNIRDASLESSYAIITTVNKTILPVFDTVEFTMNKIWVLPEIILIVNKYWDWNSNKITNWLNIWPKKFEHQYIKEWVYLPKNIVFLDWNISLESVFTITVTQNDICMEANLNGTLDQFECDMDGDGIPDICDDDIDGDGLPNLIWLIEFELDDCSITSDNINEEILLLHNNNGLDNCPFHVNLNQMDLNNNGWGDECDEFITNILNDNLGWGWGWGWGGTWIWGGIWGGTWIWGGIWGGTWIWGGIWGGTWIWGGIWGGTWIWGGIWGGTWIWGGIWGGTWIWGGINFDDEDWDWIPDHLDACPTIPENYNGIEDSDWCPEIDVDKLNDEEANITAKECFSCPCNFSDFANDLNIKDKVKAILWDFGMTTIYSETIPENIRQFLQ